MFIAEEADAGRILSLEHVLVLQYLLRHPEIHTSTAAAVTQQNQEETRETLSAMEMHQHLERGGTGRGTYWTLRPDLRRRLSPASDSERNRRIDWEAAKTMVMSVLRQRSARGEPGLSNGDIRKLTYLDRFQVTHLLAELRRESSQIQVRGHGASAQYYWRESEAN